MAAAAAAAAAAAEEILLRGGDSVNGGREEEEKKKVMVAIDESEYSHYALMWALDNLGRSLSDCHVIIFMAQPSPNYVNTFAASLGTARLYCPVSANPEYITSAQENHKKLALAFLDKANQICSNRGVKVETVTEIGDPKTAICDAIKKYNVGLLVMGERGIGKIKRAFIGSVSNYCVQNAKCPVLVVKKP